MKKKFLGILLSFALMLTMMPTLSLPAFATGGPQPSVLPENSGTAVANYVTENDEWQLTATPADGWEFEGWTYSLNGEAQTSPVNPFCVADRDLDQYSDFVANFKEAAVSYGLWVGDTAVTDKKTSGEGWSFDVKSKTLTLDGFNYEGTGHKWKPGEYYSDRSSVIFTENDLTIELKGNNRINDTDDNCSIFTIYSDKSLTINGDGVLELPGESGGYGFYSKTDLTINNATIKNNVGSFRAGGECTITGSNIETTNDYTYCLYVNGGDLVINGSTITAAVDDIGIYVGEGNAVFNNSKVTATSEEEEGFYVCGILEINNSVVESKSFSDDEESVYAYNLEMNSGRLEATAENQQGIVIDEQAVINGGTIVASGNYGFYGERKISFKGGDVTLVGTEHGLHAEQKVILSDKATVMAGDNEEAATDVTSTFAKEHNQKWVHVVVAPDPKPTPDDPTAVGTVHSVPSRVGKYVITSANTVSLVKAPNRKNYTIPATVKISGKTFKVTGINAKAFEGKKVKTLYIKTKKLTKKSVKNSLKKSKIKTVKVKVGKKKTNKKYVKKYKKIFTKKNCGKKVRVK